jgi:two-component sensor histidine kinase
MDQQISLDVDRAIHAGLIVNELVTNALKHAFPTGTAAEILVGLAQQDDQLELEVRDNGVGLPAGLDLGEAKSLGLRIVHILARRLNASVQITTHRGTTFRMAFPCHAESPIDPRTTGTQA